MYVFPLGAAFSHSCVPNSAVLNNNTSPMSAFVAALSHIRHHGKATVDILYEREVEEDDRKAVLKNQFGIDCRSVELSDLAFDDRLGQRK